MLMITSFANPRVAQAFVDYMATQGVILTIQQHNQSDIWLADESQAERVRGELARFIENPGDPRYLAASWQSGQTNSGLRYRRFPFLATLRERAGPVTWIVMLACVLVYIAMSLIGDQTVMVWLAWPFDPVLKFEVWRYFTHIFMHFSLMHILFNLLWWWYLGGAVEKRLGSGKLIVITVISALLAFREGDMGAALPDVSFLLLTNAPLSREQWAQLAQRMSWQTLRMNLNTLARHDVFENATLAASVAQRLADRAQVRQSWVYPYQLLSAWSNLQSGVPQVIREALAQAMEYALENIPPFRGNVVVCPDVSGSMKSSITGYRKGETSKIRCVDVAGLIAAAVLRNHPQARVLPFECDVVDVRLDARQSVMHNAQKLAAVGGGGTNCSAPLRRLLNERARVDLVIMVSDNESWVDKSRHGSTATMECWIELKKRNPQARLVCIDLLPYGTTQAAERSDILNVGGFSDEVFTVIDNFVNGHYGSAHWLEEIEAVTL
ncbi:TPA: TROVE domain-containing protein [Salmonella enterica subsp. enterica]|nr:TROVE domain-containing protein [Salmonella enterica subsp. enterica]